MINKTRKVGVIVLVIGLSMFGILIISILIWLMLNNFPAHLPYFFNASIVVSLFIAIIGAIIWGHTHRDIFISEIKKLYKQ